MVKKESAARKLYDEANKLILELEGVRKRIKVTPILGIGYRDKIREIEQNNAPFIAEEERISQEAKRLYSEASKIYESEGNYKMAQVSLDRAEGRAGFFAKYDGFRGYRSGELYKKRLIALGKYLQKREDRKTSGGLEKTTISLAIASFMGSILFLSNNITGNAIAGYGVNRTGIAGIILLILGLFFGYLSFKRKKLPQKIKRKK